MQGIRASALSSNVLLPLKHYASRTASLSLSVPAGAIIAANAHAPSLVGIAVCWVGLFAPGILLIFGAMPWWIQLRKCDIYRRSADTFVINVRQVSIGH